MNIDGRWRKEKKKEKKPERLNEFSRIIVVQYDVVFNILFVENIIHFSFYC